jgi:1-phosphatidylinositol-4-phosphate 5-kinase
MYNIAEGNGGKSGEFFFSYDYKYVLKTITKQEYNFIAENLQDFYDYYVKNPNSLLAKIYGLYTIKG